MSLNIHTLTVPNGMPPQKLDRVNLGSMIGVANAAGSGAGASVAVAVTGLGLPPNYAVVVNPGQDATWYVAPSSKTNSGFTVTLNPRLASATLAAGTIDIIVTA